MFYAIVTKASEPVLLLPPESSILCGWEKRYHNQFEFGRRVAVKR